MSNSEENTERAQNGKDNYEWRENEYLRRSMCILVIVFLSASLFFYSLFYFVANTSLKEIIFLFFITAVIYWPLILYIVSKEPRYIAISEDGVHFRYKNGDEKHIGWEEIEEVYYGRKTGRKIINKDGKKTNLGFVDYKLAKEIQRRHNDYVKGNSPLQ